MIKKVHFVRQLKHRIFRDRGKSDKSPSYQNLNHRICFWQPDLRHVFFKTTDIGLKNSSYWVEIDEPELLYHDSVIDVQIEDQMVKVITENIARFTLHLTQELMRPGKIALNVNGQELKSKFSGQESFTVSKKGKRYKIQKKFRIKKMRKSPGFFGPLKSVKSVRSIFRE